VSSQVFKTWFEPTKALRWHDNQLTIQVPSQFFCEWIEEHYYALLQKTIYQVLGVSARLQYQVVVDESEDTLENRTIKLPAFKHPPAAATAQSSLPFAQSAPVQQNFPVFLNPRYTFDNFIRGESNQLAVSAAMAIADNPGRTRFNPLVLYGDTGLGKTHLVQAIGNQILQKNRNARILYTSSERFTMEYVSAIQNNKVNDFTNFYRGVDVLIVDDIQFFAGKEKTQDNFFHTFNALHQSGKQLILTSDRPPKDLADVDDRLISRFQWGLTADVQMPDYEMRMAILQRKSADEGMELPQEVIEYVARHVTSSVRELEGCLISLIAKVSLDGREMTVDLARTVVEGIAGTGSARPLTINDIKAEAANYYNLSVELLEGKTRKHEVVLARQVAMFLAKHLTHMSLKSIGASFGKRDHTTVLHSCQMIENYMERELEVRKAVEALKKMLTRG
ncbi:MAG TPA: chromosomal replication initiator protein DnaA, partial [Patescibacteria group bacterium]|nr:chromosomal replication initiator protein DnaA [Patescibacteria group bacterium]